MQQYLLFLMCSLFLMSSCTKEEEDKKNKNENVVNVNKYLRQKNDYVIINRNIVIKVGDDNQPSSFIALSAICTYQGCTLASYDAYKSLIYCTCHGCTYNKDGSVFSGPPLFPLARYRVGFINDSLLQIYK